MRTSRGTAWFRVQQQDRQQGPLLPAANVQGVPVEGNLERPEKAIVDHFPPSPSTVKHVEGLPG